MTDYYYTPEPSGEPQPEAEPQVPAYEHNNCEATIKRLTEERDNLIEVIATRQRWRGWFSLHGGAFLFGASGVADI